MADPSFAIPSSFRPAFTAGGTLRRGISALVARPLAYLGFTLGQAAPVLLSLGLLFAVTGSDGWERVATTGSYPVWFWPIYMVAGFATLVPYGAALHAATEQLAGRTVSFGDALIVGARRCLPLIGVYVLLGLAVVAGTMALFFPGIVVCTIYIVSMPIAVQERRGVVGALGQAALLSRGYRVTLFVIGLGYVAIVIAGYAGAMFSLFVVGIVTGAAGVGGGTVTTVLVCVVLGIFLAAITALFPVLLAATYVGLREEKAGGSPEQIAGVFS